MVTLVLACVLIGFWVRCIAVLDYVDLPITKHRSAMVVTYRHFLLIFFEFDPDVDLSASSMKWSSKSTSLILPEELAEMDYTSNYSMIKYRNHPAVASGPKQPYRVPQMNSRYTLFGLTISYFWAIPLALISVWLLLSKPRIKQINPQTES